LAQVAIILPQSALPMQAAPRICEANGKGFLFPLGGDAEQNIHDNVRAGFYGMALIYCFLGVSIVADTFMAAIEAITSARHRILVKETGRYATVQVWNDAVANLTLMALGSSAPEILLSLVETLKDGCFSGELGPSTIIGSAAFNLLIIVAACILAIPSTEVKYIKEESVFYVTAFFSILAYIWLLVIVQVHSPEVIDWWEGVLTLLLLPTLVVISYWCDVGKCRCFTKNKPGPESIMPEQAGTEQIEEEQHEKIDHRSRSSSIGTMELTESEMSSASSIVANRTSVTGARSRRSSVASVRASRSFPSSGTFMPVIPNSEEDDEGVLSEEGKDQETLENTMINSGCTDTVRQPSPPVEGKRTPPKSAAPAMAFGADANRRGSGSRSQLIAIPANMKPLSDSAVINDTEGKPISNPTGVLTFSSDVVELPACLEERVYSIQVHRRNGTTGSVACKYRTHRLSAVPGYDYREVAGDLKFAKGDTSAEIKLTVLPKRLGERSDQFQVVLDCPEGNVMFNPMDDGGEDSCVLTVTLTNENAVTTFKALAIRILDGLLNLDELSLGCQVWVQQIKAAATCAGDEEEEERSLCERIIGGLEWPWRFIYSVVVPPTVYFGGWACFIWCLIHIALLTAIIIDLAELFGCLTNIKDSITAITFVALGTSMPDFFASRTAALQDAYADASIVNVTGSNSVNVFLGIGLPWTIAAFFWAVNGPTTKWKTRYPQQFREYPNGAFVVPAGDLAFNVIVFSIVAIVALMVIVVRRKTVGGELGGPVVFKLSSAFLMVMLWFYYLILSIWRSSAGEISTSDEVSIIVWGLLLVFAMCSVFSMLATLTRHSFRVPEQGAKNIGSNSGTDPGPRGKTSRVVIQVGDEQTD